MPFRNCNPYLLLNPGNNDDTNYGPGLAIDDRLHDLSEDFGAFQVGTTSPDEWLEINMGRDETVCKVELFFQTHQHYSKQPEQRTNIEVRVGSIPAMQGYTANPLCETLTSLPAEFKASLRCSLPLTGNYMVLRQDDNQLWDIDEINAFRHAEIEPDFPVPE